MNIHLGLRTLALLMLVSATTAVLVLPELIGGSSADTGPALVSMPALGLN